MTPPPADIDVDLELARRLLGDQHPDLVPLGLGSRTEGWDCVTIRLGDALAVRIPRREPAARLTEHEQEWLPQLAPLLSIPIPAPVRIGMPSDFYPWHWSVVPWTDGETASDRPLGADQAGVLGTFLRELHSIEPPANPPLNPYRGGPLRDREDVDASRLSRAREALPSAVAGAARDVLERGKVSPPPTAPTWLHGDLHGKNVISDGGRIAAVIDWGDICTGDPATDLAGLWIMFDPTNHAGFWAAYGSIDNALMTRAQAWAIAFGLMLHDSHHEADPHFAEAGLTTITRATTQPPPALSDRPVLDT